MTNTHKHQLFMMLDLEGLMPLEVGVGREEERRILHAKASGQAAPWRPQ